MDNTQNNPHSPLNDTHLADIRAAEPVIARAEAQIAMAKQAGLNVDQAEQSLAQSKAQLLRIKRTYFPNA